MPSSRDSSTSWKRTTTGGDADVIRKMACLDHTERALEAFGVQVGRAGTSVAVRGGQRLIGGTFHVPGDISSAAFWPARVRPEYAKVVIGYLSPTGPIARMPTAEWSRPFGQARRPRQLRHRD